MSHLKRLARADKAPPPKRNRRQGSSFTTRDDGATAVEFAIVALPFLALTIGIIEVGVDYFFNSQIDYATQAAADDIRSGRVQAQTLTAAAFKSTLLCPRLSGLTCSSLIVDVVTIKNHTD